MDRRIDLDRARRDAKALLRAAREGDVAARRRLRADREPRLADAQHAVARDLGAPSWRALVRRVEAEHEAGARELLAAAYAGAHRAALALAAERPRAAERLRAHQAGELVRAAREGRADATYTLLELGVDPNVRDPATGGTALHAAARLGLLDVVDVLVGWAPLDRRARDAAGATALGACVEGAREAAAGGPAATHLAVAKVLVSTGARVEQGMAERAPGELGRWLREQPAERPAPHVAGAALAEAAWSAQVELLAHVGRSPLAERRAVGDGFGVRTGLQDNTRNGVVCSRLPAGDDVAGVLAWLAERGGPGRWLVGARTDPADLRERLEPAGCRPERAAVFMAARLAALDLEVPARTPADLEIVPVADAATLAQALGAPGPLDRDDDGEIALLGSLGPAADATLRHYAARLDGATVGVASAFAAPAALVLTRLGVAAPVRRRGIGRALVRHALRDGRAAGRTLALLDPTPATVPFYEALGFRLHRFPADRVFYTPAS